MFCGGGKVKSISKKIMLAIFMCTLLLASFILVTFNKLGNSMIFSETDEKIKIFSESKVKDVDKLFHDSEQTVKALSSLITDGIEYNKFLKDKRYASEYIESRKNLLMNYADNDETIMSIYTYFDPEITNRFDAIWYIRNSETKEMERSYDLGDIDNFNSSNPNLDWFYGTIKSNGIYWTPIYTDSDINVTMISCVYPLYYENQMIGIVGVDISNFEVFSNLMKNMKLGKSGFAAMIDIDGRVISHPNMKLETDFKKVENGKFEKLYNEMKLNKKGTYSYLDKNQAHYVSYAKATNGKYFYIDMLESEIYSKLNKIEEMIVLILGLGIMFSLIASYVLGKSIGNPLIKLADAANSISKGDISNINLKIVGKDETAKLTQAFNKMIQNIKNQVEVAENISKGNLDIEIKLNSEKDILGHKLIEMKNAINLLVNDVNRLSEAALLGDLKIRIDENKHSGEYREIAKGMNDTLDAIISPIKEAKEVLEEMSNGNLGVRVVGDYSGDHAVIKNALNKTLESIRFYITEISEVLGSMADGNMNLNVESDYVGDFSEIKEALNEIIDSFNRVLGEINIAVEYVNMESLQIAGAGDELSRGATEQSNAIEDLNRLISNIAKKVSYNVQRASSANGLSHQTKLSAKDANEKMSDMLLAMNHIKEASRNIDNIISTIDDIAMQTNVLALNAAIEAARAGKHGKGFTVVAEEVIKLAANSSEAAKTSAELITESIKKVEEGVKTANLTAKALQRIDEDVNKTVILMDEILLDSNEQANEISEIHTSVEQISSVVQTNTAASQETAASSEELADQAEKLNEMVTHFKLKN